MMRSSQRRFGMGGIDHAMRRKGEVAIGAYARRQMLQRLLLGGIGAVLLAAGVVLYLTLRPGGDSNSSAMIVLRCRQCAFERRMPVDPRRDYPVQCPECEAYSMWPLWQCRDCDALFIPPDPTGMVRCPECGGVRCGQPREKAQVPD